ncbi:hypothetical protein GYH30_009270 [Glycine max]|uniref:Uncharacterized protein n=1 Tax=Glycine max TaxID=3847 RepID=A0A0R0K9S8_SOYBN|nr:hypothetical protein GYH30_009270 [Glycine max]
MLAQLTESAVHPNYLVRFTGRKCEEYITITSLHVMESETVYLRLIRQSLTCHFLSSSNSSNIHNKCIVIKGLFG